MKFLAFEGIDASGKSTLIQNLSKTLENLHISYIQTREPGGTLLGDELRQFLLRKEGEAPCPRAEVLLYQVIRAQHVEKKIGPHLKQGDWVLCDRFTASSLAFQSGGRGISEEDIKWLNHFSTGGLQPDLWVLLDLPVEAAFQRLSKRQKTLGQEPDRFESEKTDFHQRVRASYLKQAHEEPEKWLVLDALKSPEQLHQELVHFLKEKQWLP
ncbi:MAG: dTMP kinase [Bdellovibrio sp.]|nr:MAG: dTMP kinase [Bdellovibrio sp.]